VALTSQGETAIDGDADLVDAVEEVGIYQVCDKDGTRTHGTDSVTGRGADADGEEVERGNDGMFAVGLAIGAAIGRVVAAEGGRGRSKVAEVGTG